MMPIFSPCAERRRCLRLYYSRPLPPRWRQLSPSSIAADVIDDVLSSRFSHAAIIDDIFAFSAFATDAADALTPMTIR